MNTMQSIDAMRHGLKLFFENPFFKISIIGLIIFNAIVMGIETYPSIMKLHGHWLDLLDNIIVYIFICELILKFIAHGTKFFQNPWNIFDFSIIIISWIFEDHESVSVFRLFRIISVSSHLRVVIENFVKAIPGLRAISIILLAVFYIFAVISTNWFGEKFPDFFGDLQSSLFSLFQIMTIEAWPDIARPILKVYPYSWIFFVIYILIVSFSIMNMVVAVIVDAMQTNSQEDDLVMKKSMEQILEEIKTLHQKIDQLKSS